MDNHPSADAPKNHGFFFFADPLYWQAHEDGLAYVIRSDSSTTPALHGKAKQMDFDWDWGFQVGLGYQVPHDVWSMSLGLKHIHTNAHGSSQANPEHALLPLWTTPNGVGPLLIDSAKAHWRLHLGLLDACLTRDFSMNPSWVIAPVIGLRSAWIRQKYHLLYLDDALGGSELSMKNKFWGLGPVIGLRSHWNINPQFCLFGDALFGLLYGQYYVHQAEWTLPQKQDLLGIHDVFHATATTADLTLGVRWEHRCKGTLKKWVLEIAWDQVILFGQNQFIRLTDPIARGNFVSNQGDLSLQGVHVGALFAY